MRKIIGFIFFILSSLMIVAIVIANVAIFENFFTDLESETLLITMGVYVGIVWGMLYQPSVILLLSVLVMGNYTRR